jgi:ketosteroid isomerase-like protein
MSQENVEKLPSGFDAFARGDIDFILGLVCDDASWYPAIAPLLGLGAIRGKERIKRFFLVDIDEGFTEFSATPAAVEDLGGDSVLVQTHYAGYGRVSGAPVTLDSFSLFTFRNGKIASYRDYDTKAEALEAAGLAE